MGQEKTRSQPSSQGHGGCVAGISRHFEAFCAFFGASPPESRTIARCRSSRLGQRLTREFMASLAHVWSLRGLDIPQSHF